MKKVLILVLSIILVVSMFNFAYGLVTEVPINVYNKAVEISNGKFAILETNDDSFIIVLPTNQTIAYSNSPEGISGNHYGTTDVERIISTNSDYTAWSDLTTVRILSTTLFNRVIYSTQDILGTSDTVFFSKTQALPLEVDKVREALTSIVPNVANSSRNILVPSVAILAIMVAVSLIPRVLYRL